MVGGTHFGLVGRKELFIITNFQSQETKSITVDWMRIFKIYFPRVPRVSKIFFFKQY